MFEELEALKKDLEQKRSPMAVAKREAEDALNEWRMALSSYHAGKANHASPVGSKLWLEKNTAEDMAQLKQSYLAAHAAFVEATETYFTSEGKAEKAFLEAKTQGYKGGLYR